MGTSLIKQLQAEGNHKIRVLDNFKVGTPEDLSAACQFTERAASDLKPFSEEGAAAVELVEGDILNAELALRAAQGMDVIIHFAANTGVEPSVKDPRLDCMTNVVGTLNYLEAARHNGVKRFVLASSGAAVGECVPPLHEEMPSHPVSPYGASKQAGEAYCSAYFRTYGVETVALRFGNVYGPGSGHKNSVVAKFIRLAMAGETLEIYGDGKQTRDFIYVEDLIGAIGLAATVKGIGGEVFQIATHRETSVRELMEQLLPALKNAGIQEVEVKYGAPRQGDVLRNFSDTSKAKRLLGWQARVDLSAGLEQTVNWFVEKRD